MGAGIEFIEKGPRMLADTGHGLDTDYKVIYRKTDSYNGTVIYKFHCTIALLREQ